MFEQIFTILFAAGIGVAIVLYSARPRHRVSSGLSASAIEISSPIETMQEAAPVPEVTATVSPVVESTAEVPSSAEITPISSVTAAAGSSEVAPTAPIAMVDVAAVATSSAVEAVEAPAQSAVRPQRAPKRRSAVSKAHARPSHRTKKR